VLRVQRVLAVLVPKVLEVRTVLVPTVLVPTVLVPTVLEVRPQTAVRSYWTVTLRSTWRRSSSPITTAVASAASFSSIALSICWKSQRTPGGITAR
jgi:hypothetical protein